MPAAAAKLFAKPFDIMGAKSPFRGNYMFTQDYIDELAVSHEGGPRGLGIVRVLGWGRRRSWGVRYVWSWTGPKASCALLLSRDTCCACCLRLPQRTCSILLCMLRLCLVPCVWRRLLAWARTACAPSSPCLPRDPTCLLCLLCLQGDIVLPSSGVLTFKELNISPHRVTEGVAVDYLRYYRVGGYDFGTTAGKLAFLLFLFLIFGPFPGLWKWLLCICGPPHQHSQLASASAP